MSIPEPKPEEERYLKTAFLERVAHELRGPAGVIQGALQELELSLGTEADTHRRLLAMARRGVQRIVRTADRLQQTGQFERGTVPIMPSRGDLVALLRKAVGEAEALEARRKIAIELKLPSEPWFCQIDERWLGIALHEVASNAIRHARERVAVQLGSQAQQFEIVFRNDCSSPVSFAPVRFLPPAEARGLGLALAIVRDVVEAHGGHLTIAVGGPVSQNPFTEVRVVLPSPEPVAVEASA